MIRSPRPPAIRVALIGGGSVDPRLSREIDSHDCVIRFNRASNWGVAGTKTDVLVLCNTGAAAKAFLDDFHSISAGALASSTIVWFTTPRNIVDRETAHLGYDPQITSDYSHELTMRMLGKPFRFLPDEVHDLTRSELNLADKQRPSSGALIIAHFLKHQSSSRRHQLTLYGFSHEGWEGHSWSSERAFADRLEWVKRGNCGSDGRLEAFRKNARNGVFPKFRSLRKAAGMLIGSTR